MFDKKINPNNIFNDPLNMFLGHIDQHYQSAEQYYLKSKFDTIGFDRELVSKKNDEIANSRSFILEKKKEMKINKLITINVFIIIACVIIVGFFFLKKFKENRKIINEFKDIREEQHRFIEKCKTERNNVLFDWYSTITFTDILVFIFREFLSIDIVPFPNKEYAINSLSLPFFESFDKAGEKTICLDIDYGITGVFRNNPFIDFVFTEQYWQSVTTSKSESFPYIEVVKTENGWREEVRYETLTAYHYENTPFQRTNRRFVFWTNFVKDLKFYSNSSVSKKTLKKTPLENKDFVKNAKLSFENDNQDVEHSLNMFFTIKSQEDFNNYYSYIGYNCISYQKLDGRMVISSVDYYDDDYFNGFYSDLFNHSILNNINKLDQSKNDYFDGNNLSCDLKNGVRKYLNTVAKKLQIPLLVPGISREWYTGWGKDYFVAVNSDKNKLNALDYANLTPFTFSNMLLERKAYSFCNSEEDPMKSEWLSVHKETKINGCSITSLSLNSWWSEILYDPVRVCGIHVGYQTIDVPFETFYPLIEQKLLISKIRENKENLEIIFPHNICFNGWYEQELADKIYSLEIWTNKKDYIQSLGITNNPIVEIAETLKQLNSNKNLGAKVIINHYGIFFTVDNMANVVAADLETFVSIVNQLEKIIYKK